MITLDTSVWMNSVSPEELGYEASKLYFDHVIESRTKVLVPTILLVEMAATLARAGNAAALIQETIQRFAAFEFVHWVPLDERLTEIACDIAVAHKLRGADAVYAAVALDYRCNLISLDKDHLTRLDGLVSVLTPKQAYDQIRPANP